MSRQSHPALATWGLLLLFLAIAATNGQEPIAVPYAGPAPQGPWLGDVNAEGLHSLYYCPTPLSTNAITVVSWHLRNSSLETTSLNPKSFSPPLDEESGMSISLPPSSTAALTPQDYLDGFSWASLAIDDSEGFYPNRDRVAWSTFIPESLPPFKIVHGHRVYRSCSFSYRFRWRKREGIELLPGEGYMRRVTFFPGWELNPWRPTLHWAFGQQPLVRPRNWDDLVDAERHNPADVVVPDVTALEIFDLSIDDGHLHVVLPRIVGDHPNVVLPFRYRVDAATAENAARAYAAAQKAAKEAPGLFAELEMAPVAAVGEDLPVTYVIGVRGREPPRPARRMTFREGRMQIEDDPDRMEKAGYCVNVWLEQKSVVPANATLIL